MAPPPQAPPNCPPGLEYLTLVDQLLVKQKVEMLEAFVGFETSNKYVVSNSMGQQVWKLGWWKSHELKVSKALRGQFL